ncbi:DNA cytosine methyltransferase [Streptomyces sp. IBSNAI001]|uniref:DNA cytosine methyltransferase n=1 Tax=Streptomyces sp. IBSNAI001 TaxID=3457499 RepID=UPI003FCF42D9
MSPDLSSVHLFAGGCGDLAGFEAAGFTPRFAANHARPAMDTVRLNFPGVRRRHCDVHNLDMRTLPKARTLVGSPICTEVAPAGGNSAPRLATLDDALQTTEEEVADGDEQASPKDWAQTRLSAWDLIRAMECNNYDVVCGENVPGFATRWRLFRDWLRCWDTLGMNVTLASFDAAHLDGDGFDPVAQHRHRIAFAFTRKGQPVPDLRPRPRAVCPMCGEVRGVQQWVKPRMRKIGTYGQQYRYICPHRRCGHQEVTPLTRPVGDLIDRTLPMRYVHQGRPGKNFKPYADETRRKIAVGLERFGDKPFLVIHRRNATVVSLDEPAPAFTAAGNHHMYVEPGATVDDTRVRMLTNREKARGQGFPDHHQFAGNATEVNRLIGNAFPVTSARWLATRLAPVL